MQIDCTRHIDAGEPGDDGICDYYYEYDKYCFRHGSLCFVAKSYADSSNEVHFLSVEENGITRPLTDADLDGQLFLSAVAHLRDAGKSEIYWLSGRGNGYESVV